MFSLVQIFFHFSTFFIIYRNSNYLKVNPTFIFLLFNWIMVTGSFVILDFKNDADVVHFWGMTISPILIYLGYIVAVSNTNFKKLYNSYWKGNFFLVSKHIRKQLLFLFISSILLSFLYYNLVGYNLTTSVFQGSDLDFTTMRLNSYSGENYYAPGVFNQFKNTIFPILLVYFYFLVKNKKLYILFFSPIYLFLILGTGQRTFLVLSLLIFFFIYLSVRSKKINYMYIGIGFAIFLLIFSSLSVLLNRTDDSTIMGSLAQLIYRIGSANQVASVVGFRYIYSYDEIQYGKEWLDSLVGLIPGVSGSNLSNRIHDYMFGSMRGTAPIGVWGSAYYNFGVFGFIFLGFSIGFIYAKIYLSFLKKPKTLLNLCVYSSLFLYLSSWIAGPPSQLINNGVLGCIIILLFSKTKLKFK